MSAVYFTPSIAIALFLMFFVLPTLLRSKILVGTPDAFYTRGNITHPPIQRRQPAPATEEDMTHIAFAQAIKETNKYGLAVENMNQDLYVRSGKIFSIDIIDKEQEENDTMDDRSITCNTTYYVVITDTTDPLKAAQAYTI